MGTYWKGKYGPDMNRKPEIKSVYKQSCTVCTRVTNKLYAIRQSQMF